MYNALWQFIRKEVGVASIKEVLARSEPFKGLSDEELEKVAALGREESYAAGLSVVAEGTMAKDLYIVEKGKIAVEMNLSAYPGLVQDKMVEVVPEGQPFGWSAVVGSRVYTMSARCQEPVRVIALDGEHLLSLFIKNPSIGYKVMECLVEVVSSRFRSVRKVLLA